MAYLLHIGLLLAAITIAEAGPASAGEAPAAPSEGRPYDWGEPVDGQAISITTDKAAYLPGERIIVKVAFQNLRKESVPVLVTNPLDLYRLTVLLPDGKESPHTCCGKVRLDSLSGGSLSRGGLEPGKEQSCAIEVSRLFDMSLDGKYTILAQRSVWKDRSLPGRSRATSNRLEIRVEDRPVEPVARVGSVVGSPSAGMEDRPRPCGKQKEMRTWGQTTAGQAISIATEKAAYAPGEAITLNILLKNMGDQAIRSFDAAPLDVYDVRVVLANSSEARRQVAGRQGKIILFPDGKGPPRTLFGESCLRVSRKTACDSFLELKPGEVKSSALELTRLYDMSCAADYSVSVRMDVVASSPGKQELKIASNTLRIAVDEALGKPLAENVALRGAVTGGGEKGDITDIPKATPR